MDQLKKIFPHAFKAQDVKSLIIAIIIYIIIGFVGGIVIGLPIIRILAGILGALLEIYTVGGIVLAILSFLKIVK